jgi:CRP-like cAMP-binding protein
MKAVAMNQALTLAEDDLNALKAYGHERSVAKGQTLWEAGDEPDTLYVVRSGKANMVITSSEGKDAIVHYCAHAGTFCMAAAVTGKAYPCTAMASSEMTVLAIPRARFTELFNRLPEFAKRIMGRMADEVCGAHRQSALNSEPVKERLAHQLTRLHGEYNGATLPFTRQELANMTGTTTESTIRALSDWEKSGVIRTARGQIQIRKIQVLEEVAA